MTLHEPEGNDDGLKLLRSIKEWEKGLSKKSLISCKERFFGELGHSEYMSEVDRGELIVRCSGWRNMSEVRFNETPSFLVFDIS